MKRLIAGITFIFSGLIIYLIMHQNAFSYLPQVKAWNNSLQKFGQALEDTGGLIPTRISIGLIIIGVILVTFECIYEFVDEKQREKKEEMQNNSDD